MKCEICEGEGVITWNNLTVICPKCDGENYKASCVDCGGTGDEDPVFSGSCKKCNGLGYILPGHNTKRLYNYYKTVGAWWVKWAKWAKWAKEANGAILSQVIMSEQYANELRAAMVELRNEPA